MSASPRPPHAAADSPSIDPAPAPRDDRFPPGIPFIVGNEAAERFSFYGMRQILYVSLVGLFSAFAPADAVPPEAKVHATQITHLFIAGVYLFPLIGGILADRFLGKFRVILWVSLVYVAGHASLAIAGHAGGLGHIEPAKMAMYVGLLLVSIGSGGIKPCVSANVGDQFTKKNGHLVTLIYQIFYFTVNFGSFFASILTPYLYHNYGAEIAFAVPGILMAVAAVVFWVGRNRFIRVPPKPGGTLGAVDFLASSLMSVPLLLAIYVALEESEPIVDAITKSGFSALAPALAGVAHVYWWALVAGIVSFAVGIVLTQLRQKRQEDTGFLATLLYCFRHRRERVPGDDFWSPARIRFGEEIADGPPAVLRIIVVFSMVSLFWALFDQHSSTWIQQATTMNLHLVVPKWIWFGWFIPATVGAAIFGAIWLFLWVANRPLSRQTKWFVLGIGGLWFVVTAVLQLTRGGMDNIDLLPSQLAALNPMFVMIIIPSLNVLVYQPLERRGRPLRPLQRMAIGMFLTGGSFVAVALIQMRINAVGPGHVHVLWQFVPYAILTTAEILVSVTGLEFAYTQAPRAMKSTIMSFWLLCVTFGNVIVVFLAPLQTLSLANFFWTFAGLMTVASFIFAGLASKYKGRTYLQS